MNEQNQSYNYSNFMQEYLENSIRMLPSQSCAYEIKSQQNFKEQKTFYLYTTNPHQFCEGVWNYFIQKDQDLYSLVEGSALQRIKNVERGIWKNKLQIKGKEEKIIQFGTEKNKCIHQQPIFFGNDSVNKQVEEKKQSSNRLHSSIIKEAIEERSIYKNIYDQNKIKKYEEYMKIKRHQQIQRRRKRRSQRIKQEEQFQKKEKQSREAIEKKKVQKREEMIKNKKLRYEKRDQEKIIREKRNSQYFEIKEKLKKNPPLYKQYEEKFGFQLRVIEKERKQKMIQERKHLLQHLSMNDLASHEKSYEKWRTKQENERMQKIKILQEEENLRKKAYSSTEVTRRVDPRKIQIQLGKQKLHKIREYRQIVKQKYRPKVDEGKKRELLNLIERMELRRVKNVKMEGGSLCYQSLCDIDPKTLGMQYLEEVKELVAKQKGKPKKEKSNENIPEKKVINYLQQFRQLRKQQSSNALTQKKIPIYLRSNISYDEKVQQVLRQSNKITRQIQKKEMELKFAKFKTSQQILAHQDSIDQAYLELAKMKVKLIQ